MDNKDEGWKGEKVRSKVKVVERFVVSLWTYTDKGLPTIRFNLRSIWIQIYDRDECNLYTPSGTGELITTDRQTQPCIIPSGTDQTMEIWSCRG